MVNIEDIKMLLGEQGYSEEAISLFLEDFPRNLNPNIQGSYDAYVKDRTIVDIECDDITLTSIMRLRKANFFGAIMYMNALLNSKPNSEDRKTLVRVLSSPVHFE